MSGKPETSRVKIDLQQHPELNTALSNAGYNFDPNESLEIYIPSHGASPAEMNKLLKKLRDFGETVVDENKKSATNSSQSIRRSYWTLYIMYCAMFAVGIVTAIIAIIKGFTASGATDTYSTLIFAGLSAGSFFTLFLTRPLESLERNSIFSSWLIAVTNTYWTELAAFDDTDSDKAYDHLKKATDDMTKDLSTLADKHATAIGKYPALTTPDAKTSSSKSGGQGGKSDTPKSGSNGHADNPQS